MIAKKNRDNNMIDKRLMNSCFSYSTLRPYQEETVEKLIGCVEDPNIKYIFLNAPVGFGKSEVALTTLNYFIKKDETNGFICTSSKPLQEQYKNHLDKHRHIPNYTLFKGKSNYDCIEFYDDGFGIEQYTDDYYYPKDTVISCAKAPCNKIDWNNKSEVKEFNEKTDNCKKKCLYSFARTRALNSNICIINMDLLFSSLIYTDNVLLGSKRVLVVDEAHKFIDKFTEYLTLEVRLKPKLSLEYSDGTDPNGDKTFKKVRHEFNYSFNDLKNVKDKDYVYSVLDCLGQVLEWVDEIKNDIYEYTPESKDKLNNVEKRYKFAIQELQNNDNNWSIVPEKNKFVLRPLSCKDYMSKFDKVCGTIIFMSGSLSNEEYEIASVGGNSRNSVYINVPEDKNWERNCPIFLDYICSTSSKNRDFKDNTKKSKECLDKITNRIKSLLNDYKGYKGLICVPNKDYGNLLMDKINSDRLLSYYSPKDSKDKWDYFQYYKESVKNTVLEKFSDDSYYEKGNTKEVVSYFKNSVEDHVLISYSLKEGIDFPDDECRFIIMVCIERDWNDYLKQIKNVDSDRYYSSIAKTFVQQVGRGFRNNGDYCNIHILDSRGVPELYHGYDIPKHIPQYIIKAIDLNYKKGRYKNGKTCPNNQQHKIRGKLFERKE